MPTTPKHGLHYPAGTDDAVVNTDLQELATDVDNELDDINAAQINLANGKLLIGDGTGNAAAVTVAGDATISNTGNLEIGYGKVGTNELATDAVTSAKVADDAITPDHLAPEAVETAAIDAGAINRSKLGTFLQTKKQAVVNMDPGFQEITITWDSAYPNNNYTPVVSMLVGGGNGLYGLTIIRISDKTASGIKVIVANNSNTQQTGTINAIAIGD